MKTTELIERLRSTGSMDTFRAAMDAATRLAEIQAAWKIYDDALTAKRQDKPLYQLCDDVGRAIEGTEP